MSIQKGLGGLGGVNIISLILQATDNTSPAFNAYIRNAQKVAQQTKAIQVSGNLAAGSIDELGKKSGSVNALNNAFRNLLIGMSVQQVIATNAAFDDLITKLKIVTGSSTAAANAFQAAQRFAMQTPYTIEQSTTAYIKLMSRGLQPSIEMLRDMGNIAAVLGTRFGGMQGGIMQVVEAVADLTVGQTRRFEELGVSVSSLGNKMKFVFDNVNYIIDNNANAIISFVREVVAGKYIGAMDAQMTTLAGKFSVVQDAAQFAIYEMGKFKLNDQMKSSLDIMTKLFVKLKEDAGVFGTVLGTGLELVNTVLDLFINNLRVVYSLLSGIAAWAGGLILAKVWVSAAAAVTMYKEAVIAAEAATIILQLSTYKTGAVITGLSAGKKVMEGFTTVLTAFADKGSLIAKVILAVGSLTTWWGLAIAGVAAGATGLYFYLRNSFKSSAVIMQEQAAATRAQTDELNKQLSVYKSVGNMILKNGMGGKGSPTEYNIEMYKNAIQALNDAGFEVPDMLTVASGKAVDFQKRIEMVANKIREMNNAANDFDYAASIAPKEALLAKMQKELEALEKANGTEVAYPGSSFGVSGSWIIDNTSKIKSMRMEITKLQDDLDNMQKAYASMGKAGVDVDFFKNKIGDMKKDLLKSGISDAWDKMFAVDKVEQYSKNVKDLGENFDNLRYLINSTINPLTSFVAKIEEQIAMDNASSESAKARVKMFYDLKKDMAQLNVTGASAATSIEQLLAAAKQFDEANTDPTGKGGVSSLVKQIQDMLDALNRQTVEKSKKALDDIIESYLDQASAIGDVNTALSKQKMMQEEIINKIREAQIKGGGSLVISPEDVAKAAVAAEAMVESKERESKRNFIISSMEKVQEMEREIAAYEKLINVTDANIDAEMAAAKIMDFTGGKGKDLADKYSNLSKRLDNLKKVNKENNKEMKAGIQAVDQFSDSLDSINRSFEDQRDAISDGIGHVTSLGRAVSKLEAIYNKLPDAEKGGVNLSNLLKARAEATKVAAETANFKFGEFVEKIKEEGMWTGITAKEQERSNKYIEAYQLLQEQGIQMTQEHIDKINAQIDANEKLRKSHETMINGIYKGLNDFKDKTEKIMDQIASITESTMDDLTDVLANFFSTGKFGWEEMVKSWAQSMLKFQVQQNITGPLSGLLSNFVGSYVPQASKGLSLSSFNSGITGTTTSTYSSAIGKVASKIPSMSTRAFDSGYNSNVVGSYVPQASKGLSLSSFNSGITGTTTSTYSSAIGKVASKIPSMSTRAFDSGYNSNVVVHQPVSITVNGGDSDVEEKIVRAMKVTRQQTMNDFQKELNRGGSFARSVGRL